MNRISDNHRVKVTEKGGDSDSQNVQPALAGKLNSRDDTKVVRRSPLALVHQLSNSGFVHILRMLAHSDEVISPVPVPRRKFGDGHGSIV